MDFKGQTAVLSAFVLVGIMFLVPAITEKALPIIRAFATGWCGDAYNFTKNSRVGPCVFTLMNKELKQGVWKANPTQSGTDVSWETAGSEDPWHHGPRNEEGFFTKLEGEKLNYISIALCSEKINAT